MIDDRPASILGCAPFLQRLGLLRIRPRQNSSIDVAALQSQRTPVPYPEQETGLMPASRILEPEHGVRQLWPWSEHEILENGNNVFTVK